MRGTGLSSAMLIWRRRDVRVVTAAVGVLKLRVVIV